jgi:acetyl/propionyl-CoA carboxylase alpha subunit
MKKILVANRSEIACRVFQTAKEMGVSTVAIFAPGDEEARHLSYADEVIGVDSYLNAESVVRAAVKVGAHLIHPGYGFLSERPVFARAIEKAGIQFLGPTAATMEIMGGKIDAKEKAIQSGVPTLPWARVKPGDDLKPIAQKMGFPVLLKAAAGGGGKGMRRVDREEDLDSAAESASSEAIASFGDGTLFMEKLVLEPRHIEVQVFGDGKGGGVHLFERECTLQRRHQKVWEEATAPHLPEETRKGLFEASLNLVRGTNYRSAGTLEFLVDQDGKFYFLEMNTRLQVEHPVSEQVTGVDLVRAQIELGLNPDVFPIREPLSPRGHSIEVRLYAEDPSQGFMPTPGTVKRLRWPTGTGIRVESGIEEGQVIGTSFDSLLGKLIVSAPDRAHAIARMRFALDETVILGMGTNQSYLRTLCDDPRVIEGRVHTHYLEEAYASFAPVPSENELEILKAARKQGLSRSNSNPSGASFSSSNAEAPMNQSPWFQGGNRKGAR